MKIHFRYALVSLFAVLSLLPPILAQDKLDAFPAPVIYFGHGGGFTGMVTTYALLQNGDLYKRKSLGDQDLVFLSHIDSIETKSIFANYSFLGIETMQLSEPGNTYSFISYKLPAAEVHKLVWSKSISIPGNLKTFYDQLIKLIQSN